MSQLMRNYIHEVLKLTLVSAKHTPIDMAIGTDEYVAWSYLEPCLQRAGFFESDRKAFGQEILNAVTAGPVDPDLPHKLCVHRQWPLDVQTRFMILVEELTELTTAARGKGGDKLEEAGDVLIAVRAMFTTLGLDWDDVEVAASRKIKERWDGPRRTGEVVTE